MTNNPPDTSDLLTIAGAATLLGISRQAVHQKIQRWRRTKGRKGLASALINDRIVVSRKAVEALRVAKKIPPPCEE